MKKQPYLDATAQRPQLLRSVLAHAPRQPGSWLTCNVDIAAWSQAGTKEFWSATAVEADEGGTAAPAAEDNVRPGETRETRSCMRFIEAKEP
jgi:hypothetical protein